jgi:hypothetical protein
MAPPVTRRRCNVYAVGYLSGNQFVGTLLRFDHWRCQVELTHPIKASMSIMNEIGKFFGRLEPYLLRST